MVNRGEVRNVTERVSNPFGIRAPCSRRCSRSATAVFGYGDANADFHVVGDHPGIHGGKETGVPFTESAPGRAIQRLLFETGFTARRYASRPELSNCFMSYLYMCCTEDGGVPSDDEYDRLERYFDAEFRAINSHVILPVGERPTVHVLRAYTTLSHKLGSDMDRLHATDVRGRGFLVVPIKDPIDWSRNDRERITTTVREIRASDYRQTKGVSTLVG